MTKYYFNIGGIVGALLVVSIICEMLLRDKIPLLSINTMQSMMNHWAMHWHIIAIGVLPVYVALIFFSASIVGLFLGSTLQHWLMRFFK
jgi:hypothetical protein